MKWLSFYDLTGIQPYIFGSNQLQENLGASYLVKQALEVWLAKAASEVGAEFQWAGGGNAMVTSQGPDQARRAALLLSAKLHKDAPGLNVACAHHEWDESPESFESVRLKLEEKLNCFKAGRWPEASFDGAGVTAACTSTGEPAVARDNNRWLGAAAQARLDNNNAARDDIQNLFELSSFTDAKGHSRSLVWTKEIDKLGRSRGEQSVIGVIHFDGNGMGHRFRDAKSLAKLHELSVAVNWAGKETLCDALSWALKNLAGITDQDRRGFELHAENKKGPDSALCFPVRPIVYGGDDITLVCESRIALDLAAELLRSWHRRTADLPGGPAHACAGVAMVGAHYPFYRAYELAEELCKSAKRQLIQQENASLLDWEFIAGAGLTSLKQRRERLYKAVSGEQLHARPYYVLGEAPATESFRNWNWFRDTLVAELQVQDETHTRFKELAGILALGPKATGIHLERLKDRFGLLRRKPEIRDNTEPYRKLRLPEPKFQPLLDGFANGKTPYLDAIELMDRVLPLDCYPKNSTQKANSEDVS